MNEANGLHELITKYKLQKDDPLVEILSLLLDIKQMAGKNYQATLEAGGQEHPASSDIEVLKQAIREFVEGKVNVEVSASIKQVPPEIDYDKLGGAIVKAMFPGGHAVAPQVQGGNEKRPFWKGWFTK